MTRVKSLRVVLGLAGFLLLGLAAPGKSAKNPNTPCGYNVTSTVADNDMASPPQPLQLQSDGLGSYVTYGNTKSGTDNVLSAIQANSCDWVLDLSASASRTVKLSLAYADNGGSLPAGWPTDGSGVSIAAHIISICSENSANNGVTYGTMKPGEVLQCGFNSRFNYGGQTYTLYMNPSRYSGTSWAQVTCGGPSGGPCTSWAVVPGTGSTSNPLGQNSGIGELGLATNKGVTPLGTFEVAFSITITNP
jgi:hypothetical protein